MVASLRQSFRNALFSPIGEDLPHSHPYRSSLPVTFLIRQVIVRLIPSYRRVPLGGLTYCCIYRILSYVERWVGDRSICRAREHPCALERAHFVEQCSSRRFIFLIDIRRMV